MRKNTIGMTGAYEPNKIMAWDDGAEGQCRGLSRRMGCEGDHNQLLLYFFMLSHSNSEVMSFLNEYGDFPKS
jgi:hypothetical protein